MKNFNQVGRLFIIVLSLLTSACATSYRIPVYDNVLENISTTEVRVGFIPEKLRVLPTVTHGSAAVVQFGLFGGLVSTVVNGTISAINESRANETKNFSQPLNNVFMDANIKQEFSDALDNNLSSIAWLKASKTILDSSFNENQINSIIDNSSSASVMLVSLNYYISPDVMNFIIEADMAIYPSKKELRTVGNNNRSIKDDDILYRNHVTFVYKLDSDSNEKGVLMQEWTKGHLY